MKENYYDILEINKNASQEIVEKAYKTLVKKYHPDLQEQSLKPKYEEKIKKINEAYDVLSNPEKRKQYDLSIKSAEISQDDYNNLVNKNIDLENQINNLRNNYNANKVNANSTVSVEPYKRTIKNVHKGNYVQNEYEYEKRMEEAISAAYNEAYRKAYIQDMRNRGYKIKTKKSLKEIGKDIFSIIVTILIFILVFWILWHIPATKEHMVKFYNESPFLQLIVNMIQNYQKS